MPGTDLKGNAMDFAIAQLSDDVLNIFVEALIDPIEDKTVWGQQTQGITILNSL